MRGLNGLRGLQYADGSDIVNLLLMFFFIGMWGLVCLLIYKFLKIFLNKDVAGKVAYGLFLLGAFAIFVYYIPWTLIVVWSFLVSALIYGLMAFLLKIKLKEETEGKIVGVMVLITLTLTMFILGQIGWLQYFGF